MTRAVGPGAVLKEVSEVAKKGSWFFDGYEAHYEVDAAGKKKKVLEYVGERYGLGAVSLRRVRAIFAGDILLLTLILLLINFFPGLGGMLPWIGGPALWALIPVIFLLIGLFNFLTCGERWMIRQFYAGYRRIGRWAMVFLVLMVYVAAAHAVFLICYPAYFPGELYYTAGALSCAALAAGLVYMVRKWPAVVVQGPVIR